MKLPLQIVFRDFPRSEAVESAIRDKADKLEQFFDRIMGCRVTAGLVQKHPHQGRLHYVRIDLTVPGAELVVNHDKSEDIYVAIRDAFDHARRQLEDYARKRRGEVKNHRETVRTTGVEAEAESGED